MKALLKIFTILFAGCFGLGLIVSWIEKLKGKVGWVEGHKPYGIYEKHIKRPLDFALALFALILFWPILLIIAIAVKINMGSPVIFEQDRPGLGGKIFKIKKFRTMVDAVDADGKPLPDDQRLTKFGTWLRASSGDEALELFSIAKGDLSFIGPRPLLVEYLPYYTKEEMHRHDVRPGLTGLSQTSGRNCLAWNERFKLDVQYVNKITFVGDARIFLNTIRKVVDRDGILTDTSKGEPNFARERKEQQGNG